MKSADTQPLLKTAGLAPLTGRESPRAPTPGNRSAQAGFLLPLSIMGSLLLVTGNVALQLADLQVSHQRKAEEERNSDNDQLLSAAHLIGDYITPPRSTDLPGTGFKTIYSCLGRLSFNQWSCQIAPTRPVATASSLAATINNFMEANNFNAITIKGWTPIYKNTPPTKDETPTGGILTLQAANDKMLARSFYIRFPSTALPSIATEQQT